MSKPKIKVNGEEVSPIKKTKLPEGVDWQALALKRQQDLAAKKTEDA